MTYPIETNPSVLVPFDFPSSFLEDESMLVTFLQYYYQYLEQSNNTIGYMRQLLNFRDIDYTNEEFLQYFLQKYLPGVQLQTYSDVRLLLKHNIDFLRARGTERADKLFFATVYGEECNIYVPSVDMFRLSSGDWYIPQYLEITHRDINPTFIGKEVVGLNSGAECFIEKMIRRKISQASTKYSELFYISAINGTFQPGEILKIKSNNNIIGCPIILGSLNSLEVIANEGSYGFNIGDIVNLSSNSGYEGLAIVSNTQLNYGLFQFNITNGGYGFTTNNDVIISNTIITIANVQYNNTSTILTLSDFSQFIEPLVLLTYQSANAIFVNGDIISCYSGANLVANGLILGTVYTGPNTGILTISPNYGNLAACGIYYSTGNTKIAYLVSDGFSIETAQGNVVGISSNTIITMNNVNGAFQQGEKIYQKYTNGMITCQGQINTISVSNTITTIYLTNSYQLFFSNQTLYGQTSGTTATSIDMTFTTGLYNVNNYFSSYTNNVIIETNTGIIGTVNTVFSGGSINIQFTDDLYYTENITVCPYQINQINSIALLSSNNYGFPTNTVVNGNTLLSSIETTNLVIGSIITGLVETFSAGNSFSYPPFIKIQQPLIETFDLQDWIVTISNTVGTFSVGELVTQNTTNMRGFAKSGSNSTVLYLQRLRFYDDWSTNNSGNTFQLRGYQSGATALVDFVFADYSSNNIGNNASFNYNIGYDHTVTALKVIDSGFGFVENDVITFSSNDGLRTGEATAIIGGQGTGEGFYRSEDGFASSSKKLRDGYYYQEFSYEIQTGISLDVYEQMLLRILHVAGMQYFGSVVRTSNAIFDLNTSCASIVQSAGANTIQTIL